MSKSIPLVSVVIITYNSARYLSETIESILNQTVRGFEIEIIVSDDGSTDDTIKIAGAYKSMYPFIRILKHDRNDGVLNLWERINQNIIRGFKACRGEYLRFIAGDDYYYDKDSFLKQVQTLENDEYGRFVADAGRFLFRYPDDHYVYGPSVSTESGIVDAEQYYRGTTYIHAASYLIRRKFLDKYSNRNICFDDSSMTMLLLLDGIHYNEEVTTVVYRQHFNSIYHGAPEKLYQNKMMDLLYIEALRPVYGSRWPKVISLFKNSLMYAYLNREMCRYCFNDDFKELSRKYNAPLALAIYGGDEEANDIYEEYEKLIGGAFDE